MVFIGIESTCNERRRQHIVACESADDTRRLQQHHHRAFCLQASDCGGGRGTITYNAAVACGQGRGVRGLLARAARRGTGSHNVAAA